MIERLRRVRDPVRPRPVRPRPIDVGLNRDARPQRAQELGMTIASSIKRRQWADLTVGVTRWAIRIKVNKTRIKVVNKASRTAVKRARISKIATRADNKTSRTAIKADSKAGNKAGKIAIKAANAIVKKQSKWPARVRARAFYLEPKSNPNLRTLLEELLRLPASAS